MYRFSNILFCPLSDKDTPEAGQRVADLATRSKARLTLLGVIAEPSRRQRALHRARYLDAARGAERRTVAAKLTACGPTAGDTPAESDIVVGPPALKIIERVVAAGHDLVIVTSDGGNEDHATLKTLLRKCPCPVWTIRQTRARTQRVLAAVNPRPSEAALNRTILELAASMVDLYGGELHVVHAWELYGEAAMRSSAFLHTSATEVHALLAREHSNHGEALRSLLTESGVEDHPWEVHLHKGPPAQVVGEVVAEHRINLLVMGTVARKGLTGLIMGNTAEKVLDNVRCSVVAVKPPGFPAPIDLVHE